MSRRRFGGIGHPCPPEVILDLLVNGFPIEPDVTVALGDDLAVDISIDVDVALEVT